MCEENRPKQVGDPCDDESDCEPQVATWEGTEVTTVYLRCDLEQGTCVSRDPPVVEDWLAACGLELDSQPGYAYGYMPVAACTGGVCLYLETDECMLQGCTIPCDSDGDCPMGAVCEDGWQVCKPGPPNNIGLSLSCP